MTGIDDNKQLFLDMQEHPENYSDEQLERMMDRIDRVADADAAWRRFEQRSQKRSSHRWLRVAAAFIGVLTMAGITFAAVQWLASPTPSNRGDAPIHKNQVLPSEGPVDAVHFANTRLDSILTIVSAHYRKTVVFRDEAPCHLRLIMTWQPDAPLTEFLDRLNAFEGLSVSLQNDTIVVQTNEEEGRQ